MLVPAVVVPAQTPSNEPPSFGGAGTDRSIAENSEAGAAIGEPVAASDDTDTALTYSLGGVDAGSFAIDGIGQLSVGDGVQLDYESKTQYSVTVSAADSAGASAAIDVAITVTDVNDPSIVLIMADDAGYEVFGAYGTTQYSTPELDDIAAAGARFTNMFSLPSCPPTRVALMTGKSNVRNYVDWATLRKGEYTFGDLFSDAGYATAIGGKWQLHQASPEFVGTLAGAGFDTHCLWQTKLTRWDSPRYWNPAIGCDGVLIDTDAEDYGPDIFTDFHLDFIEANRDRPFFAYYPMVLPHDRYVLPPGAECADADGVQCIYEKMVARADHNVGRIYDKLESLGLLDNTILMFTADNGTPGEFATLLNGRTLLGGKGTTLDAGTRVPLIAWVPGQAGGRVLDDLVHIADIFPTLADAAGIEVPDRDTNADAYLRVTLAYTDGHGPGKHAQATAQHPTLRASNPAPGGDGGGGGGGGGGDDQEPEPVPSAGFADVDPTSVHAPNIGAIHAANITLGCSKTPRQYCPDQPVTRAQMATFLTRALNLEPPDQQPA